MANGSNVGRGRFGGGLGRFSYFPPVIKFLLATNIGIFLFGMFFGNLTINGFAFGDYIETYGALFPIGSHFFRVWQPLTYMFLHANFMHVGFNMLALWMFGVEVEHAWGSKKFLTYYLICGLGGAAAHLFVSPLLGLPPAPLVGASGAVFGILAAFGLMFPDRMIYFYFFIPMRAKYFVLLYLGLELFSGIRGGDNIGHFAHLGGAIAGMIYMMIDAGGPQLFSRLRKTGDNSIREEWQSQNQPRRPSPGFFSRQPRQEEPVEAEYSDIGNKGYQPSPSAKPTGGARVITQEDVDRILDKIAATGYQNLTTEEREVLFEASRKMDQKH